MFKIIFVFFSINLIDVYWCNNDDILSFDWSTLSSEPKFNYEESINSDYNNNRRGAAAAIYHNQKNDLESDFGVFEVMPTRRYRKPRFSYRKAEKKVVVPQLVVLNDNNSTFIKTKVNNLLRNYLTKLYHDKYYNNPTINDYNYGKEPNFEENDNYESKIFDGTLWNLKNKTKTFANKFLSLFTVVKFANTECSTNDYIGTCYHETQCQNLNGTAEGTCANDYGVCCVFKYSCGGVSNQNCTYFESPGYPDYDPPGNMIVPPTVAPTPTPTGATPDPRWKRRYKRQTDSTTSCTISIMKISSDIQQMRIDFIDLELAGPTNGTCIEERLVISGQNVNDQVPVLCGYNTGQHVYVDVSMLSGPLQLSVLSTTGARKRYKIRICQVEAASCSNTNNCLQYYTGITGQISSFNYDQAVVNRSSPGYFNNLNYAICIRKEAGYCSITYTNTPAGMEYPFQMVNVNDNGQSTVPPGQAGAEIFNCPDDYIVIGGIRLCGDKFNDGAIIDDFTMNAPVTDTSAGPIIIPVRTNEAVTGRGFKLFYTQNRCVSY